MEEVASPPEAGTRLLGRLARKWAPAGPPVVVFNKSHSGSRVLARLLQAGGVFMGEDRNESEDAADMLRLVQPLVERYYPEFAGLMRDGDASLEPLVDSVLDHQLRGRCPGQRWGWKLCETLYILPVLHRIFPDGWFVHLIRDGRDVAFSDHVAPVEPFWRKVYFDTDRIAAWNGRRLDHRSYQSAPHVFNARHWVNSVTVARHYGAMIGARYLEIRYEDLVSDPQDTARRLFATLDLPVEPAMIAEFAASVTRDRVGKHRHVHPRRLAEALEVLEPTLAAFGYSAGPPPPVRGWRAWLGGR